jgi:hypothetical protein
VAGSDRWRDLYRVGAVACVTVIVMVSLSVAGYFWRPYAPREESTREIFESLRDGLLGALVSLDIMLPVTALVTMLVMLALYAALRPVNESWALIALVVGIVGVVLIVPARPIAELVYLSDQYAAASSEAARSQYLAAGEALIAVFDGTAWMVFTVFIGTSGLISSLLMLRSEVFTTATAWLGVVATVPSFGFFIPVLGPLLLFVGTFAGVVWYVLLAWTFYRLGWGGVAAAEAG